MNLQMFSTPSAKNLYMGAGPVYFNRFDAQGNPTGLRHLGNVEKMSLKTDVQKVTKKSSMSAARVTYAEAIKEITAGGAITLDEFDPKNLALGLYGQDGVTVQGHRIIADEPYTVSPGDVIRLDCFMPANVVMAPITATPSRIDAATHFADAGGAGKVISGGTYVGVTAESYYITITAANTAAGDITGCKFTWRKGLAGTVSAEIDATGSPQSIDAGVTAELNLSSEQSFAVNDIWEIKVTPAGNSFVVGRDYRLDEIELRGGVIRIPETSAIPKNTKVKISYEVPEHQIPTVSGASVGAVEGMLLFMGDPSRGPCYIAEFWHVSLTPDGEIDFIGEDFGTFNLNYTCMDDSENHPDHPMYKLSKVKR